MSQEAKGPKYYNSPENPIYHKSDVLYGFYFARRAIRERDNVYLVEGYTDVISMSEAGVENVVASSGTALTDGQIKLIKSQTNNITVLYDGDNAGIKASLRGINMLLAAGLNVKAVLLPDGEDPDSFAKGHRDSELKDYLEQNAVNIIQFEAKTLMHGAGNDPLKRAEVVNTIIETVAEVNDEVLRAFYVRECAELFQLSEESLQVNLKRALWKRMNTPSPSRVMNIPQQSVQQGQPVQQQLPNVVKPEEVPQTQQPPTDPLYDLEYNILRLILKYGFFETNVRDVDADGQEVIRRMRVDQYVFNEFHAEEISFTNPLWVRDHLRGKKGTKVQLCIKRGKSDELLYFTVTRGKIPMHSINVSFMVDKNTGYIKLDRFAQTSLAEFQTACTKLQEQGMKNLIFDLRGNGGGYLNSAVQIASQFIEGNKLVVYTDNFRKTGETLKPR